MCISWELKCWILLMHCVTMKFTFYRCFFSMWDEWIHCLLSNENDKAYNKHTHRIKHYWCYVHHFLAGLVNILSNLLLGYRNSFTFSSRLTYVYHTLQFSKTVHRVPFLLGILSSPARHAFICAAFSSEIDIQEVEF